MKKTKRNWTEEQKQSIIDDYERVGLTCTEIAKKYAAKADTISKYLKEWGIAIKGNRTKNRLLVENYFSIIDKPEKAYFLGLLFADGSVVLDPYRSPNISLELQEQDKEILIKFKKELCSNCSLSYSKRKDRNGTYTFSVRSKQLAKDLSKFNIIPNKTYLVNEVIFPNFLEDFLRGYIDGDGSIYQDRTGWHLSITGHSFQIISQFQDKIDELIGKKDHNKITCYKNTYKAIWNGKNAINILKIIYNGNICLTRKQLKATAAQEDKKS